MKQDSKLDEKLIIDEIEIPKGLLFDKRFNWIFLNKNGNLECGISDFLQKIIGKIDKIKINIKEGQIIQKGDLVLSIIQDGKRLNIFSPINGKILLLNYDVIFNPSKLKDNPYLWIYSINNENWNRELRFFMVYEQIKKFTISRINKLKDFIQLNQNELILQDGGELKSNLLEGFSCENWENFQNEFIDNEF